MGGAYEDAKGARLGRVYRGLLTGMNKSSVFAEDRNEVTLPVLSIDIASGVETCDQTKLMLLIPAMPPGHVLVKRYKSYHDRNIKSKFFW